MGVDTFAAGYYYSMWEGKVCYDQSDKLICDPWNYRLPARNLAGVIKRENNGERRKYSRIVFPFSQVLSPAASPSIVRTFNFSQPSDIIISSFV